MNRPRVLVVDDRPSVLKLLATVLEGAYDVTSASDGATALSLIGSAPVDVVLTDARMPGASGFEVLRAVRARAPRAEVVMMTAYANIQDAVAAMKLGAYDYVAKPAEADEILLVVARAAAHAREREEGGREPPSADGYRTAGADAYEGTSVCFRRAVEQARDRASRAYLVNLMRVFHGNVTRAAERAGMTRESLHRVLKTYGVRAAQERDGTDEGGRSHGAVSAAMVSKAVD